MLSERERRALEDLERSLADDVECPPGKRVRRRRVSVLNGPWTAAVVIGSVSVFLMMAGAGSGGLALAVAGASGWLLARYWRPLRELGDPALLAREDTIDRRRADS